MPETAPSQFPAATPLATARYIHAALGDLALLAQQAQMETTEAMILAARIEALSVVQRLRGETPQPAGRAPLARNDPAPRGGNGKAG